MKQKKNTQIGELSYKPSLKWSFIIHEPQKFCFVDKRKIPVFCDAGMY